MKRFFFPLVLLFAIALSGCSFATKTPVPTNTPTQGLIIRVATPTPGTSPSPRPTLTPTLSVTSTITATIDNSDRNTDTFYCGRAAQRIWVCMAGGSKWLGHAYRSGQCW